MPGDRYGVVALLSGTLQHKFHEALLCFNQMAALKEPASFVPLEQLRLRTTVRNPADLLLWSEAFNKLVPPQCSIGGYMSNHRNTVTRIAGGDGEPGFAILRLTANWDQQSGKFVDEEEALRLSIFGSALAPMRQWESIVALWLPRDAHGFVQNEQAMPLEEALKRAEKLNELGMQTTADWQL